MWERPIFELEYYSFLKKVDRWGISQIMFSIVLCIHFEKYAEIVSIFLFLAIYFL